MGSALTAAVAACGGEAAPRQQAGAADAAASSVDDDDRALLDVKVQRDQLRGHLRRLTAAVAKDDELARKLVQERRKDFAMLALKQKKQHQGLLQDCQQQEARLEELIERIEFARMQKGVVEALASGVETLRRTQKAIGGVDRIHRIFEEHADLAAAQAELGEALGASAVTEHDAEALEEYARLEAAVASQPLDGPPAAAAVVPAGSTPRAAAAVALRAEPAAVGAG